jgi:hypothetical protein
VKDGIALQFPVGLKWRSTYYGARGIRSAVTGVAARKEEKYMMGGCICSVLFLFKKSKICFSRNAKRELFGSFVFS